jgi:hypothetical protein
LESLSRTKSVEIEAKLVAEYCKAQEACSVELFADRMLLGLFPLLNSLVVGRGRWSDVSCLDPRRSQRLRVPLV